MLSLAQIETFYPEHLRVFKHHMLREYLQYKILEIIYASSAALKLNFMGGTAIRLLYGNQRFSEDLDFDNLGLSKEQFKELGERVEKKMAAQGFDVKANCTFANAYRCSVKISGLLKQYQLSAFEEEKILIQIDSQPQQYVYESDKRLLNQFDVFCRVNAVPSSVILSQKLYAFLNRRRTMGRDMFDCVFLWALTEPDYDYLQAKIQVADARQLKQKLLDFCRSLNCEELAEDVKPFVFHAEDVSRVVWFKEFVEQKL